MPNAYFFLKKTLQNILSFKSKWQSSSKITNYVHKCNNSLISGIQLMLCGPWFLCNRERNTSGLVRMPTRNISFQTF